MTAFDDYLFTLAGFFLWTKQSCNGNEIELNKFNLDAHQSECRSEIHRENNANERNYYLSGVFLYNNYLMSIIMLQISFQLN